MVLIRFKSIYTACQTAGCFFVLGYREAKILKNGEKCRNNGIFGLTGHADRFIITSVINFGE